MEMDFLNDWINWGARNIPTCPFAGTCTLCPWTKKMHTETEPIMCNKYKFYQKNCTHGDPLFLCFTKTSTQATNLQFELFLSILAISLLDDL